MKKLFFTLLLAAATLPGWAIDQVDGVYQIGNADDLIAFSTLVNDGTNTANAVLTADIDMSSKTYTPIGNDSHRYKGTFDGQGHVIDHLVLNNSGYDNQGIFGVVQGATIKNLIAGPNNSIKGKDHVGGLVGITNGDELVTIENCGNEGYVEASGTGGAAIIGICYNGSRKTKILNCYNTGKIKANAEGAVLTGWFGGKDATAEVKNFYNIGDVEGQEPGKYFYRNGSDNANITFDNVYDNHSTTYTQTDKTVNACNAEWYRWPYDLNFASTTEGNRTTVWKFVGSVNHPRPIAQAPVSKDGDYYLINSNHDLYWFATVVNAGNASYKAKQTADINFTAYTNKPGSGTDEIIHSVMIGWEADHPFSGEYDGQEHNVQVSYDRTAKNTGLFRYLKNATIKNLCTTGTIKNTASCSGGIFAGTVEKGETGSTVENCLSSVTFDRGETGDDATFGGIGAYMHGSGIIKNCAFLGTISAKNAEGNGGILGYANGGANVKVQNCYVNATISVANDDDNNIIVRHTTPENCYYVTNGNLRTQTGATQVAAGDVSSGKLCYTLNGNQSNINWYQTLHGTDSHPYPFDTHKQVYQVSETSYSNIPASDGKVQISNAADLMTFSAEVNAGNTTLNAVLTNDIDMSGVNDYTPIGTSTYKYAGTFDGQYKTIKLNINTTQDNQALFGIATANTEIKNLIVEGSVTARQRAAGLIGYADGNGTITLTNIINKASIDATASTSEANAAGLVGCAVNGIIINATNCGNTGKISNSGYTSGTQQCAAFAGWLNKEGTTFTNCWNIGEISNMEGKAQLYRNSQKGSATNCYYLIGESNQGEELDATAAYTGELCYKLGGAFTQDLSQDGYPTFASKTVTAGKWFNDTNNDVYYNLEDGNYTVYQLNMSDTNTKYEVPANVTAKNVSIARTIPSGQWIGLCLPFALETIPSGWDVRELTSVTGYGENASMKFSSASTIEAGKPYIVKPTSAVTTIAAENKTIATVASTIANGGVNMIGNFAQTSIPVGSYYINTSSQLKKLTGSAVNMKGFRAYFTVGSYVKALNFDFDDDATGISLMEDGRSQMEDGAIYNLAGQRINKMQRGINIVNGKKILK